VTWVIHGRCKSGSRWFWVAAAFDGGEVHKCDDPVCIYGGPHEYGWEDAEDLALKVMAEAVARLGGEVRRGCYQGNAPGQASAASSALKRLNAAKRAARPPSKETAAGVVEYLYGPWSWSDDYGETHKGISEYQITKKTAKRIYYIRKPGCSEWNEPPTIGYIDRGEFEADTRCREDCPRDVPALVCGQHGRTDQHCVHFGEWCRVPPYATPPRLRNCGGRGCGEDCPRDVPAGECREHHYTWEHCPHGHWPGQCWKGDAPGEVRTRNYHDHDYHLFATREAAEDCLFRWERERECKRKERGPELRRLRLAMADAHPDRGGTDEEFIAARERYERALRQAS
jgi:hypothetical protein